VHASRSPRSFKTSTTSVCVFTDARVARLAREDDTDAGYGVRRDDGAPNAPTPQRLVRIVSKGATPGRAARATYVAAGRVKDAEARNRIAARCTRMPCVARSAVWGRTVSRARHEAGRVERSIDAWRARPR
jgi:hypothetical protein